MVECGWQLRRNRVLQCRTHRLYSSGTQTGSESAPPRRRRTRSPPVSPVIERKGRVGGTARVEARHAQRVAGEDRGRRDAASTGAAGGEAGAAGEAVAGSGVAVVVEDEVVVEEKVGHCIGRALPVVPALSPATGGRAQVVAEAPRRKRLARRAPVSPRDRPSGTVLQCGRSAIGREEAAQLPATRETKPTGVERLAHGSAGGGISDRCLGGVGATAVARGGEPLSEWASPPGSSTPDVEGQGPTTSRWGGW